MFKKCLTIFLTGFIVFSHAAYGAGLRTTMGHINIENLAIGQMFSLEKNSGSPFTVSNSGDEDTDISIEVLKPGDSEAAGGFEPIPDVRWIKLDETEFTIPANGKAATEVTIEIPNEEIYRGKAYQAYIWIHSKGGSVIYGLKAKLFITIAE